MKAGPVEIGTLLQNRNRFCVPIYQRHYVWSKIKQLEPFWQDIRTKAVERLAGRERRFSHFMGAVVLESRAKPSVKQVPSFQVVDGQQRLTTFQIFLTAARHYAQHISYETAAANILRYTINSDPQLMELPEVEIYKVWPTQADRTIFIDIVVSKNREELKAKYQEYWYKGSTRDQIYDYAYIPKLLGAYGYFYDRIRHSVETDDLLSDLDEVPDEIEGGDESENEIPRELKLDAIWQSLLEEFKVVEIVLDDGDDAQVIFETLNDRGEPLLAADLIRNNIFQRADATIGSDAAEKLFAKHWKSFEDPFWFLLEKQGRYKKQRIEFFIANFIAGKIAGDVTISKLFSEYKGFLRPRKGSTQPRYATISDEIQDVEKFGAIYKELIERTSESALSKFSQKLRLWDVTTVNPLAMRLWAEPGLTTEEKDQALKMLLSLIVRRAVCKLSTKNYNNLFLTFIAQLDNNGWTLDGFKEAIVSQKSESGRFPIDIEFEKALRSEPIYQSLGSAKTRALLIEIELFKRGKKQESNQISDDLTVEHVLPSEWRKHWTFSDGTVPTPADFNMSWYNSVEDDSAVGKIVKRDRLKHTLGNLTLVTQSFNSTLNNHPFDVKKPEYEDQAILMLTKDIVKKSSWSEEDIEDRSALLAPLALSIWAPIG